MIQRSTCMYNGQTIGIESIYTVVNGQQINIPDKLESLRTKGKNNELFCPCGCGANLTLVAGDKNLIQQHFRIKDQSREKSCAYVSEGLISVNSKIVLKCWLEDKLKRAEIETRAPICPEYGGKLCERIGRYGSFVGCSNSPFCKFTRNK